MAIGEKLWEGKAKSMTTLIKDVNSEGVSIVASWMAQLKGVGKAKGLDGTLSFTGKIMMGPNGAGWSHGQGIFNLMTGEMAVVKSSGIGKIEAGKGKSIGLASFMSMSPKLAWVNTLTALVTQEGDPNWMEWDMVVWEWK